MIRYEALMLAIPEITQDEAKQLESQFEGVVTKNKGSMVSFERWGKFRLAYSVKKNDYGVYFLARFEMADNPKDILAGLQSLFTVKVNDLVMRNMVARLDATAPLTYQRPHSLEEAPSSKDVNVFLRENKMEGLLQGQRHAKGAEGVDMIDESEEEGMA